MTVTLKMRHQASIKNCFISELVESSPIITIIKK